MANIVLYCSILPNLDKYANGILWFIRRNPRVLLPHHKFSKSFLFFAGENKTVQYSTTFTDRTLYFFGCFLPLHLQNFEYQNTVHWLGDFCADPADALAENCHFQMLWGERAVLVDDLCCLLHCLNDNRSDYT